MDLPNKVHYGQQKIAFPPSFKTLNISFVVFALSSWALDII